MTTTRQFWHMFYLSGYSDQTTLGEIEDSVSEVAAAYLEDHVDTPDGFETYINGSDIAYLRALNYAQAVCEAYGGEAPEVPEHLEHAAYLAKCATFMLDQY